MVFNKNTDICGALSLHQALFQCLAWLCSLIESLSQCDPGSAIICSHFIHEETEGRQDRDLPKLIPGQAPEPMLFADLLLQLFETQVLTTEQEALA